jgi:hypothetical protein
MKRIEKAYAEIKKLHMVYGANVLNDWNRHSLTEDDRQYRAGYANGLREALRVVESLLPKDMKEE